MSVSQSAGSKPEEPLI
ncbi:hypothetical protein K2783_RS24785 [Escherichia coli]